MFTPKCIGIFFLQKIGPSQGIWSLEVPNFPVALHHIYGDSYIRGFRGQSSFPRMDEWKVTLPETNSQPTPLKINGWKMNVLLGWPILRGELLVSGSVIGRVLPP